MEDTIPDGKVDVTANFGSMSSHTLGESVASTAQSSAYTGAALGEDCDFTSPFY